MDFEAAFRPFQEKMEREGLHPRQIERFREHYRRLREGASGMLTRREIEPVEHLPSLEELEAVDPTPYLDRVAVIKLNGGLGTSMGLQGPKSLLPVKGDLTFLDVLARQVLRDRQRLGCRLPLLLMNSFRTSAESRAALERYPDLPLEGLPGEFLQSRVPKVQKADLSPVRWPADPGLEWCPPGHGDLYLSLEISGTLDRLLEEGFRWAFVSNIDNLGATLEPQLLGWLASQGIPFVMEATRRTPADRKGGHLARHRANGRLVLRESAQCPPEEVEEFQDVERYAYFNTNTLWLDLEALRRTLAEGLELPLIVNQKTVDPRDATSPAVYQLETAMGAAISCFEGARAVVVPRSRFAPVKTTADLLTLWSDAYLLDEEGRIRLHPGRADPPLITLDPRYYRLVTQLQERFPRGAPSLVRCRSLEVRGDVRFGGGVRVVGEARVEGPGVVPEGAVLKDILRLAENN